MAQFQRLALTRDHTRFQNPPFSVRKSCENWFKAEMQLSLSDACCRFDLDEWQTAMISRRCRYFFCSFFREVEQAFDFWSWHLVAQGQPETAGTESWSVKQELQFPYEHHLEFSLCSLSLWSRNQSFENYWNSMHAYPRSVLNTMDATLSNLLKCWVKNKSVLAWEVPRSSYNLENWKRKHSTVPKESSLSNVSVTTFALNSRLPALNPLSRLAPL